MLIAPRRLGGLVAALMATSLILLPGHALLANDTSAPLTTGSISPEASPQALPDGSGAFRRTLDILKAGDYAEAYAMARGLSNPVERRTIQWAAIYYGGGKVDHAAVARFAADAPDFAPATLYKSRLEQALVEAAPPPAEVIAQLGGVMPNTLEAKIALATAYSASGQSARATRIARDIWINNFLDRDTEALVLQSLGRLLDRDAHWQRAVHLMMHDRAAGTERLLGYFTPAQQSLAVARNATSRKDKGAKALLDKVDPAFRDHPVYLFSRAQRARQAELFESAVDWLNKAKGDVPDATEWWVERRLLTRQLLAAGQPKLAYQAAAGYTSGPEGRQVEAQFHAGWIALSFLKDARTAKTHFEKMRAMASLPDTVTQANYWLGRALTTLGDDAGAKAAFTAAAHYSTVYYGQLARRELGLKDVALRALPAWQGREVGFDNLQVVRAIRLLAANGQKTKAVPLLRHLAQGLSDGGDLLLAARLAQAVDAHHVAIAIADIADKRGAPLDLFSFPKDGLPASAKLAAVDKAAVYAVARQESHFQADAVSGVGARGLMQLMPGTAKETAAKLGLEYSSSRLIADPAYNAALGSSYLAAQLARYDGSLVLAAAAYNAGAGNANKWIAAFGDPRHDKIDPVVWVELIPFQETRKYVQRVLGNYMVYRARMGDDSMTIKQALRRIPG